MDRGAGVQGYGTQSKARYRTGAGAHCVGRRLLRETQALSECGFLFRHYVSGNGLSAGDVHGAIRNSTHGGVAGAMAGTGDRSGAEDYAPAASVYRTGGAPVRADGAANFGGSGRPLEDLARAPGTRAHWPRPDDVLSYLPGGQRSYVFAALRLRSDHLHLLPVVRKLSSAFQASHIRSGQCASLRASGGSSNGHREAVTGVPATDKHGNQFCNHETPSTPWVLLFRVVLNASPRKTATTLHYTQPLRFGLCENGFVVFRSSRALRSSRNNKCFYVIQLHRTVTVEREVQWELIRGTPARLNLAEGLLYGAVIRRTGTGGGPVRKFTTAAALARPETYITATSISPEASTP